MIAVIDYGMGNLKSVANALITLGQKVVVTRNPQEINDAKKVILPGVGAFPECMKNLEKYGLVDVVKSQIQKGKWFLGICLGLQLLFDESEEMGGAKGLGILPGTIKRFDAHPLPSPLPSREREQDGDLKIPQIGWNEVVQKGSPLLFKNIPDKTFFYFVHSYYLPVSSEFKTGTVTEYGIPFVSSIEHKNILACQFHPEKSQKWGLEVLKNFCELK